MSSIISEGVEIHVETFYQPEYSNPANQEFMFAYHISIENHNAFSIQLIRRYWHIVDSMGERRFVEGDGVVGIQPILKQGEQFDYVSGCNLKTEIGKMYGYYVLTNLDTRALFNVKIPSFKLIAPFKCN